MRTVLNHVNIIDGLGNLPIPDGYVAIEGEKILETGLSTNLKPGAADQLIDCKGFTILPGLIDAHIHIYATGKEMVEAARPPKYSAQMSQLTCSQHLHAHLKAGFTSVRDMGSENDPIWALRHAERVDMIPSPHLIACGKLVTVTAGHGTEYGVDMAWECDGVADLIKGVRRQHAEGADFIKIIASRRSLGHPEGYPAWPLEELQRAVKEAHALGLKVAAHASGCPESIDVAIGAGVDSIEHGWGITREMMKKTADKGILLVPTLSVFRNLEKLAKSGKWRRSLEDIVSFWGSQENRQNEIEWAKEFGVPIVAGTDAGNPDTFHGDGAIELELLVEHGLSPLEAIKAATSNASRCCGVAEQTGSVETGKQADLVLVKGNPLEDITILQEPLNIRAVFKAGRLIHTPYLLQ